MSFARLKLCALLLCVCAFAAAQQTTPASPPADTQEQPQGPTFRANVREVPVYFVVKDKHGALVPNLTKDSFTVLEDGTPQTIKSFRADTDRPLTLGLMIDTSGSQMRVLDYEKEAGAQFIKQVLTPKDEAFMISFDVNVNLDEDLTGDKQALIHALNKERINVGGGGGGIPGIGQGPINMPPKGTLLFDAAYLAANDKMKQEAGRKALIFLTDGGDQGSQMKLRDAIEATQKADTICYVILISDSGQGSPGDMRKLSEETGGRLIQVGNNFAKLEQAFQQIGDELRSQYELTYTPTNTKMDGGFRKIEVKEKDGDKVQARKGYYAQAGNEQ
ncbi:MAG: VWA domain-containing protein [Acidobacteriaceae bacterium]